MRSTGGRARVAVFLLFSLIAGTAILIVTPPFAVPDEPGHFYRAWSLSEGRWRARVLPDGRCGARLPVEVVRWTQQASARVVPGQPAAPEPAPDPDGRVFVEYRGAAQLPAPLYLPQAAGIAGARLLGGSPGEAFQAARASSLAVVSLGLALALSRLAWGFRPIALSLLLPTTMALRASSSADAVQLALVVLLASEISRILASAGRTTAPAGLLASLAAFGAVKPVYFPLALLVWPATASMAPGPRRRTRLAGAAVLLLPALFFGSESARVQSSLRRSLPVDPAQTVAHYLRAPGEALFRIASDLLHHAPRYAAESVGSRLGWLDVEMHAAIVVALALALLALVLGDRPRELPPRSLRCFAATAGLASLLSILGLGTVMLIQWTPLDRAGVEGLQGRYFLPLVAPIALAAAALPDRLPRLPDVVSGALFWLAASLGALAAVLTLAAHYG